MMKRIISKSKYLFMLLIIACTFSCSPEDGMDGLDGINGVDGIQGVSGQNGSDGQDGADGTNGNNGVDGENGTDGQDGVDGADGTDGQNGNNGEDGEDGENGQDGADGQNGQNGTDGQDGQDAQTYSVGDFAQGGIIFWLDATKQHGLACDIRDINDGNAIRWYAGTNGATRATGDGIYAGENNTTIIISSLVAIGDDGGDYAALLCNDLEIYRNGDWYGDWYLPSGEELITMRRNRDFIDEVATDNEGTPFQLTYYWTSTESATTTAWGYNFNNNTGGTLGKNSAFLVRAIRAF